MTLAELLQCAYERAWDEEPGSASTKQVRSMATMIRWEADHWGCPSQLLLPIRQLTVQLPGFQPRALPRGEVDVLDRERRKRILSTLDYGGIEFRELSHQHSNRPPIGNNMVHGES
jgi:hypothetical protein